MILQRVNKEVEEAGNHYIFEYSLEKAAFSPNYNIGIKIVNLSKKISEMKKICLSDEKEVRSLFKIISENNVTPITLQEVISNILLT